MPFSKRGNQIQVTAGALVGCDTWLNLFIHLKLFIMLLPQSLGKVNVVSTIPVRFQKKIVTVDIIAF